MENDTPPAALEWKFSFISNLFSILMASLAWTRPRPPAPCSRQSRRGRAPWHRRRLCLAVRWRWSCWGRRRRPPPSSWGTPSTPGLFSYGRTCQTTSPTLWRSPSCWPCTRRTRRTCSSRCCTPDWTGTRHSPGWLSGQSQTYQWDVRLSQWNWNKYFNWQKLQ